MSNKAPVNPWARHKALPETITKKIDHDAIERAAKAMLAAHSDGEKRKLKGIYFDADIAAMLDDMKNRRVNVSGFVNDVVRRALSV